MKAEHFPQVTTARVAVFVDGDNLSASHAAWIRETANRLGRVDLARVYLDTTRTSAWTGAPGFRTIHAATGKNSADMLICIEAVELALGRGTETFVLVTSDSDFTHLSTWLRERGHRVHGMGEREKVTARLEAACSEFSYLTLDPSTDDSGGAGPSVKEATDLDHKIRETIEKHSKRGDRILLKQLAGALSKEHGICFKSRAKMRVRPYLAAKKELYDVDPKGPNAMVRLRGEDFA